MKYETECKDESCSYTCNGCKENFKLSEFNTGDTFHCCKVFKTCYKISERIP